MSAVIGTKIGNYQWKYNKTWKSENVVTDSWIKSRITVISLQIHNYNEIYIHGNRFWFFQIGASREKVFGWPSGVQEKIKIPSKEVYPRIK